MPEHSARDWLKRFPTGPREALIGLALLHLLISLFWLSQGGYHVVKDTPAFLAIATRSAEVPFFADPYDTLPATDYITTNAFIYAYFVNALQVLPGGFAPYHFVIGQVLHFLFICAVFAAMLHWHSPRTSFFITLLGLLEPLHYVDILTIAPSVFSQPTIGISLCLALIAWKTQRLRWLAVSALVLGIGLSFRTLNLFFVPLLLLMILVAAKSWKHRLLYGGAAVAILVVFSLPRVLFLQQNPHLAAHEQQLYAYAAHRSQNAGYFTEEDLPQTLDYFYKLDPRLRDQELVAQYEGTSIPFFMAFMHDRVNRDGITPGQALSEYYVGGEKAFWEDPVAFFISSVHVFFRNWGIQTSSHIRAFNYDVRLSADEIPPYGNTLIWMMSCTAPFEDCLDMPAPDLIADGYLTSLHNMPHIDSKPLKAVRAGWSLGYRVRGIFFFAVICFAFPLMISRKAWDQVLFFGGIIGTYLVLTSIFAMATTGKIVMVLPWIAWLCGSVIVILSRTD